MIKKVRLTTTLAKLLEYIPCALGWETLLKSLPEGYPTNKPINLLHILKSNGVQDTMWALRAATPDLPKLRVAMCADMAARTLKYHEAKYPDDKRPRDCIKACRRFVRGEISLEALQKCALAASRAASATVAAAYAAVAAGTAARAAFSSTASFNVAYSAAYAACAAYAGNPDNVYASESAAQALIIRKYLK